MSGEPYTLHLGDCREVMRGMESGSVDAVITDPPYDISFMGKAWDGTGIAFHPTVWAELLRVIKPGGHLLAFGGTRTSHRMVCAIEDAGWDIRDSVQWLYGSGFPKSMDISKAIDRAAGAEREVIGTWKPTGTARPTAKGRGHHAGMTTAASHDYEPRAAMLPITSPATEAAKAWEGWETGLKPAHESICLARAPLAAPTIAANVLAYGTGALNIDATRISYAADSDVVTRRVNNVTIGGRGIYGGGRAAITGGNASGRWPANLILSHDSACELRGTKRVAPTRWGKDSPRMHTQATNGYDGGWGDGQSGGYESADGTELVENWVCVGGCPVAELDRQSGVSTSQGGHLPTALRDDHIYGPMIGRERFQYDDRGTASRFFYVAKASRAERGQGNTHPCVKPVQLLRYLCRLITPQDGVILDPFTGSGSTGVAALAEGFRFIGIEQEPEYFAIAQQRLGAVVPTLFHQDTREGCAV